MPNGKATIKPRTVPATASAKTNGGSNGTGDQNIRRTTLVLPDPLDRNITIECARQGITKTEFFVRLARKALTRRGLNPDRLPNVVTVSY